MSSVRFYVQGIFLSALVIAGATYMAQAQQRSSQPVPFSEALAALRPPPSWSGRGDFESAPGATAQLRTGAHGLGDAFAEVQVLPIRTARLTEAVSISDPANGQLNIPEGTPLFAQYEMLVAMGAGAPQFLSGKLQWCAQIDAQSYVYISRRDDHSAEYQTYGPTARHWSGPMPIFQEQAASFAGSFARRLLIHQINADGVVIESAIMSDQTRVRAEGTFGPGPFDHDLSYRDVPNLAFRFHASGAAQVIVQAR